MISWIPSSHYSTNIWHNSVANGVSKHWTCKQNSDKVMCYSQIPSKLDDGGDGSGIAENIKYSQPIFIH